MTGEPEATPSGLNPKIWVGSLADYNDGHLHGAWFDATRDPDELALAAKFMLRTGYRTGAEEWAVMDYDGFVGVQLGEYESLERIGQIAWGIAEHGEAFGHWAAYVGSEGTDDDSTTLADSFEEHYRGEWESFEAYIEDYLEDTGFFRLLEQVPEDMRGYVAVDVQQIARDWGSDYEVAELRNGRVAVFSAWG